MRRERRLSLSGRRDVAHNPISPSKVRMIAAVNAPQHFAIKSEFIRTAQGDVLHTCSQASFSSQQRSNFEPSRGKNYETQEKNETRELVFSGFVWIVLPLTQWIVVGLAASAGFDGRVHRRRTAGRVAACDAYGRAVFFDGRQCRQYGRDSGGL